jgi:TolB-like protein
LTLGVGLLTLLSLACAEPQPVVTPVISREITSTPPGATVYIGTTRDNLKPAGKTPLRTTKRAHSFPKLYYQVRMEGHFNSKVVYDANRMGSFELDFVLQRQVPPPKRPRVAYPEPEDVAVTPINMEANGDKPLSKKGKIAIMTFREPSGSGAGSLVADSLILNLQRRGYQVIDREQIEKVMREQGMMAEGQTELTDLEVSKRLGKLLQADYFIYGAITEYSAKSENVSLSPVIRRSELDRYARERVAYLKSYEDAKVKPPSIPDTVEDVEFNLTGRPRSSYINIARVGVTAKIVEISSSDIIWVGFANLSDLRLQRAMERIVAAMIGDFTGQAREIVAKAVEASGGAEALGTVTRLRTQGRHTIRERTGSTEYAVTETTELPDRRHLMFRDAANRAYVWCVSELDAWRTGERQGTAVDMTIDAAEEMREAIGRGSFGTLQRLARDGNRPILVGSEKVSGRDAFVLATDWGDQVYIDEGTHELVRIDKRREAETTSALYSAYRPEAGVLFPRVVRIVLAGRETASIRIDQVEVNPEVPDALFDRPVAQ